MSDGSLAALDLGSNSFHMIVARRAGGDLQVVDRLRDPVRLAAGIGDDGTLSDDAQTRALECLTRFGQRLRDLDPAVVRVVGTNTLRSARNGPEFQTRAELVLGHRVEVISGQEEARLIYLGVSHTTGPNPGRRLVVDIGGGSTEAIVGDGFEVVRGHSMYMGCVSFSRRFFGNGSITAKRMKKAKLAAALELRAIERDLRELTWSRALGASGTIRAVGSVLAGQGWTDGRITATGLEELQHALIDAANLDAMLLEGLRPDRAPVFPGGVAILAALVESLAIDEIELASGALREGVLYDLLGRIEHEDVRERTIAGLVAQYLVDTAQATRVAATAQRWLAELAPKLDQPVADAEQWMHWAAQLHEIGLAVAYTGYHKHGAYLVQNGYLPGFSSDDQRVLATIIRGHRRSLKQTLFQDIPENRLAYVRRLTMLFRLAVKVNRSRVDDEIPRLGVKGDWKRLVLEVTPGWAESHPLTVADLQDEASLIEELGTTLEVTVGEAKTEAG